MHVPWLEIDPAWAIEYCSDRLAQHNLRLVIENDAALECTERFRSTLVNTNHVGICFDVGHEMLFASGILTSCELADRIELLHLHGVNLRRRIDHLDPWISDYLPNDPLREVIATKPDVPVIVETKYCGWPQMYKLGHESVANLRALSGGKW